MRVNRWSKMTLVASVGVAGLAIATRIVTHRAESAPDALPLPASPLTDPEPHLPFCRFWSPWRQLAAPDDFATYLRRIRQLVEHRANRDERFEAALARARGVTEGDSERICVDGRFDAAEVYHLGADGIDACATPPTGFLDVNFSVGVERLASGSFVNTIRAEVGLGRMTPAKFLAFTEDGMALVREDLRGWSVAAPAFFTFAKDGLGLSARQMKLKINWQNQRMVRWAHDLGSYLLGLADLARIDTTLGSESRPKLLSARTDTLLSGIELDLATFPTELRSEAWNVSNDVKIRFRDLVIGVNGVKFRGHFANEPGSLRFAARFQGADAFKIGGSYRGLSLDGGMGQMIRELIEETMRRELTRLTDGNHGQGWTAALTLTEHDAHGVLHYETAFESTVNLINVLRANKDETGNPVLPDRAAVRQFNEWGLRAVDALQKDFAAAQGCD